MQKICGTCNQHPCICGKKVCNVQLDNNFMKNLVEMRRELGEDEFEQAFDCYLVVLTELSGLGFAAASCLLKDLRRAHSWMVEF